MVCLRRRNLRLTKVFLISSYTWRCVWASWGKSDLCFESHNNNREYYSNIYHHLQYLHPLFRPCGGTLQWRIVWCLPADKERLDLCLQGWDYWLESFLSFFWLVKFTFSWLWPEHMSVICVLYCRWILLWTGREVSDAGLSQTHKGCVGHFWFYRCCLYSNKLPREKLYI